MTKLIKFPSMRTPLDGKTYKSFYSPWRDWNLTGYSFRSLFQNFDYVPETTLVIKGKKKVLPSVVVIVQARSYSRSVGKSKVKHEDTYLRVHDAKTGKKRYTVRVVHGGHGSCVAARYTAAGNLRVLMAWDKMDYAKKKQVGSEVVEVLANRSRTYSKVTDEGVERINTFDGADWVEPIAWIDRKKLIFAYRARKSTGMMRFSQRSLVDIRKKINKKLAYTVVKMPNTKDNPNQGSTANSDFIIDQYHKTNKRATVRVYRWRKPSVDPVTKKVTPAPEVLVPDWEFDLTNLKSFTGDKISTSFELEGCTFLPDSAGRMTRLALSMRKNSVAIGRRVYRTFWVNLYELVK